MVMSGHCGGRAFLANVQSGSASDNAFATARFAIHLSWRNRGAGSHDMSEWRVRATSGKHRSLLLKEDTGGT